MFDSLGERLGKTVKTLRGRGRLSEKNIKDALRDVRIALLEADVALPVVKSFIAKVRERALGQEVIGSLSPGQAVIKIVSDQLTELMGGASEGLHLNTQPPAVILLVGLQGAGKTTSVAKLARHLQERHNKKVMVASCDIYRPAAIEQLQVLAAEIGVAQAPFTSGQPVPKLASAAIAAAKQAFADVLLIDTAGRLHVDEAMMDEVKTLHEICKPAETLFVVDSMTGQDAVNTTRAFADALPLSGVILTKTDGDARGGAALSLRMIAGKPIKFIGSGEKTTALEPFHPDRIASRILGMGDVLSLVEEVEQQVDQQKAEKLAKKIKKGKDFDLCDLRDQMQQMQSMGGLAILAEKLPGMGKAMNARQAQLGEQEVGRIITMINSMTPHERRYPALIKGSRKLRIAKGSGVQVQDVNRMLKQHLYMSKMMKKAAKGGMANMMRGFKGKMPPGPNF